MVRRLDRNGVDDTTSTNKRHATNTVKQPLVVIVVVVIFCRRCVKVIIVTQQMCSCSVVNVCECVLSLLLHLFPLIYEDSHNKRPEHNPATHQTGTPRADDRSVPLSCIRRCCLFLPLFLAPLFAVGFDNRSSKDR